jgi:glycosyltransferase involved in cell wall biosynthesis
MKLYINGRFLTQPVTGVQRFAIELVRRWDMLLKAEAAARGGGTLECILLAPQGKIRQLSLRHIEIRQVGGNLRGHRWEQLALPWYARDGWLINLCNTGPLLKRRQIVTIHDAAVFAVPSSFSLPFRLAYRAILLGLGVMAKSVLTVSSFSKSQLMQYCRIPESKIRIASPGSEHILAIRPDTSIYSRLDLVPGKYLLAVSSLQPSKNFANLVKAIELLEGTDCEVVIAGGMNTRVFGQAKLPVSGRVKLAGYVTDAELKALYDGAACFVYPSFYEGFGIPPLEAMACGTPVLVANAASLPEVCEDAVVYCDPHRPDDIARQIRKIMTDGRMRDQLGQRGQSRAVRFRWATSASLALDAVKEAIGR